MTTEGPKYTYSTSSVMTTTAGVAGIEPTMAPVQAITQLLQTGIPLILETTEAPLRGFTGRHTSETTAVTIMGASVDESSFYVLGGVIAAVAVLLLCITVLGLQYMFKHKGSYLTNEEDEYESIENTDIELQKDTDLLEAVGEQ
ncbi:glycophorin-C-like isoform X3 [Hypomesus transpacificus]|uniref:glycophorin-C-like isoform X3 n=1 Tax=Hypomesus transpacificus TaxID=137520 RepID=UPI001F083992|nr:glycophorin-C-like isoform X3 [Hypomesus transpacificus]